MHITDEHGPASVPGGSKQFVLFFGSALGSYLTSKDQEELDLYKLGFVTCACLSFQLHLSQASKSCQRMILMIMRRWFGVLHCLGLDPVCKPVLIILTLHKEFFCNRNYPRIEIDLGAAARSSCMLY